MKLHSKANKHNKTKITTAKQKNDTNTRLLACICGRGGRGGEASEKLWVADCVRGGAEGWRARA